MVWTKQKLGESFGKYITLVWIFMINVVMWIFMLRRKNHAHDTIIDIGCGKGRMLEFFSRFGFSKIAGLEYSPELAEIARKNMETLQVPCEILTSDASIFSGYDDYNYFYLFNLFSQATMEQFVERLKESLLRRPRKITIIYTNPICLSVFVKNGFHSRTEGFGRHKFCVITLFADND